jgi:hypothetical protein
MKLRRHQHSTDGYSNDKDDTGCRQIIDNGRQPEFKFCVREILQNQVLSSQGLVVNLSGLVIPNSLMRYDLYCYVITTVQ